MYYDDRSDFGAIIAGMVFLLASMLLMGINAINFGFDLDFGGTATDMETMYVVLGVLGIVISGFTIYKGFFVDGVMFAAVACWMLLFGPSVILSIVIAVVFVFVALMCYFEEQYDLVAMNVILAATVVLLLSTDNKTCIGIGGIVALVAGIYAIVLAFFRWRDIQDYTAQVENSYFEDECCCEGECHCEDEKKE